MRNLIDHPACCRRVEHPPHAAYLFEPERDQRRLLFAMPSDCAAYLLYLNETHV